MTRAFRSLRAAAPRPPTGCWGRVIRVIETAGEPTIGASWVADRVLAELDPRAESPVPIAAHAHELLRTIAADYLALRFDPAGAPRGRHIFWGIFDE